jgi:hypothetical protein
MDEIIELKQQIKNLKTQVQEHEVKIMNLKENQKQLITMYSAVLYQMQVVLDGKKIQAEQKKDFKNGIHFEGRKI